MNKQPCLDPLHAIETASVDELRALQLERMKNTMHHAYKNSPAYRAKFDDHGVSPDDLQSLEDLDLRDNYPFGMFAVPMEQVVRVHASSGTTGKPTVVGYTRDDIDVWSDVVARSIRAAGGSAADKVATACSLVAWGRIMAPSAWVVLLSLCPGGRRRNRCS
jgi:phenylacetate-CoA ligase